MIDKIKKFTVDDKNNLLSKTFYVLPDNPSDKHFSPSQIRKKGYEGYLVLFEFLNSVIDAINDNVDLSNEDIEAINANITTLQSYFSNGIALQAIADKNGNDIVTTYETKADSSSKQSAVLSLLNGLEASILDGTITSKKAERDANGNVINETYETKADASSKLANAKLYADGKVSDEATARASADADLEARKVNVTDIVDGLNDTSTNKPLSANMGKALKAMIDTITSILASDDTDLDTLQEIVAYVKDNKSLIDSITVTKVNVSDIIDNLTSEIANKPVSAKQAFILKGMIDALTAIVSTKANSADVYDKTTTDAMLALKADAEDVYDKDEIDAKIHGMLFADIDEDFNLESENPVQNKVISKEIEDINYTIMVMKEELFETILSEIDYKVDFATLFAIPDTLSDDDGQHRVVYSDTQLKEVEGNSFAFNQLVSDIRSSLLNWNGLDIVNNNDHSLTFNGTYTGESANYLGIVNANIYIIGNHKYLLKGGKTSLSISLYNGTTRYIDSGNGVIISNDGVTSSYPITALVNIGATFDNVRIFPQLFDLTASGIDSVTTVDEAKAELLKRGVNVDEYNEYSAGEIRNTVIKGVKVNGYNLLNLDRTLGTLTGWNEPRSFDTTKYYKDMARTNLYDEHTPRVSNLSLTSNSLSFSTNSSGFGIGMPVNILSNTAYTFSCNVTTQNSSYSIFAIVYYDENGNYISNNTVENTSSTKSLSVTTPNNAKTALLFFSGWADAGLITYSNICFHLTGSRTGYAPYKEPHTIQIPETELLSAGSVHDTIKFVEGNIVEDEQRYNMVHVSRVGSGTVDSILNEWQFTKSSSIGWYSNPVKNIVKIPETNDNPALNVNMVCANGYVLGDAYGSNMTFRFKTDHRIWFANSLWENNTREETYNIVKEFIINYEKAEYTETTLATDLTFEEVSAIIEQNGSIEALFENVPPNIKTAFVVKKAIMEGE